MARRYLGARDGQRPPQGVGGPRVRARWRIDEPGRITARTRIAVAPPLSRDVYRTNTYSKF